MTSNSAGHSDAGPAPRAINHHRSRAGGGCERWVSMRIVTVLICATLAACAAQPRMAKPSQVFGGQYIHIEAPGPDAWEIIGESSSGIAFAKGDRSAGESFIAWVSVFGLPPTNTPE